MLSPTTIALLSPHTLTRSTSFVVQSAAMLSMSPSAAATCSGRSPNSSAVVRDAPRARSARSAAGWRPRTAACTASESPTSDRFACIVSTAEPIAAAASTKLRWDARASSAPAKTGAAVASAVEAAVTSAAIVAETVALAEFAPLPADAKPGTSNARCRAANTLLLGPLASLKNLHGRLSSATTCCTRRRSSSRESLVGDEEAIASLSGVGVTGPRCAAARFALSSSLSSSA